MSPHGAFPPPPQIPGQLVQDPERLYHLKGHLANICGLSSVRFPGSQPVSFDQDSLKLLEKEDFWVCEKSDGVRVLVLILASEIGQEVFLVDRKEDYYENFNLSFPHQDGPQFNHSNTVLDGELVVDRDPKSGKETLRLLAFDCLVLDGENVMQKPLTKRYGRLKEFVIKPHLKQLQAQPERKQYQPFEVLVKTQDVPYHISTVMKERIPDLMHGNDGLIFTSAESAYTPGTDKKIIKWKPPSENSIDFLLQLRFPPLPNDPSSPDLTCKPLFLLLMNHGRDGSHYYDVMDVPDSQWEAWKASGEQYDDRVVEVTWDKVDERWVFMRFRDDKFEGNYKTVVESIIKSIKDGVEAETLIEHESVIKMEWKRREHSRNPPPAQRPPPQQSQQQQGGQRLQGGRAPPMQGSGGYGGGGGGGQRPAGGSYGGLQR